MHCTASITAEGLAPFDCLQSCQTYYYEVVRPNAFHFGLSVGLSDWLPWSCHADCLTPEQTNAAQSIWHPLAQWQPFHQFCITAHENGSANWPVGRYATIMMYNHFHQLYLLNHENMPISFYIIFCLVFVMQFSFYQAMLHYCHNMR